MLKQGSVGQLRSGELTRAQGYIVVCMAFYPRGLKKDLLDEYRTHLAPDKELFKDWKNFEQQFGHDEAFKRSNYEARFTLNPEAMESLRRLTDKSRKQDVYLLCQCEPGQRCHREILLLIARDKLGADIGPVHNAYPVASPQKK
jgi:uncharacterized protein YeaO (DUF488 family)